MSINNDDFSLGDARNRLYDILEQEDLPIVEKYRQTLAVGCAYLGVENGHLKRIPGPDGTGARVSVAAGDISWITGDTELEDPGFCRMTVKRDDALAIADVEAAGYEDNPGYVDHGVACYLAARVVVAGDTYGTVCFVSSTPRERSFDHEEQVFVELLAQLLGRQMEQEHHAEALAESHSKYASLIEASPDPVFLLDTDSGTVVEANRPALSLTCYSKTDLEGRPYTDLWNAESEGRSGETIEWIVQNETARRTHPDGSALSLVCADGTSVPVEITASQVNMGDRDLLHAVVRDIRDERERERRTEAIFDQTHQFTGLLSPDGTLLEANDTAMEACEEEREDILGIPFPECPWWQTNEGTREQLRDAINRAADGEFVRYEVEIATARGPMMIDFSIRPITDEDGNVELLIPEGRDISQRYERDRQLDVLARVLRHNFRNDMTVIRGHADHVLSMGDSAVADSAKQIERTAGELSKLVEGYYETVSLLSDPPELRPVSLTEIVSVCADNAREECPEADISLSMPSEAWIRSVPSIQDAVDEVLDNAVRHAGSSPRISVSVSSDSETVSVTIADNGPGIPAQEARVLTGEQSTTPLDHSTGIDLWRVYWLCDLSGADITVDTSDGTSVTITFEAASCVQH